MNHNANIEFDKIPHGRDRPTDQPWPISAMLKNQDSCSICLKKWSFFASQKSEKMTHEIERTGMIDINISN